MGFVAHHLIQFSREALRGNQNASFYSTRGRDRTAASHREAVPALRRSA
jgi:hopanoid C-2 methylase